MRSWRLSIAALMLIWVGCQTPTSKSTSINDGPQIALQHVLRTHTPATDINVNIDAYDVPHIMANSATDAYFAQGFLHAYYRLWQMEYRARSAEGTVGLLTAGALTSDDLFAQRADLLGAAKKIEVEILRENELKDYALAYCNGVNSRIRQLTETTMPPQYKQHGRKPRLWTPLQIALVIVSSIWAQARPANELLLDSIKLKIPETQFLQFFPLKLAKDQPVASRMQRGHVAYKLKLDDLQSVLNTGSSSFVLNGKRTSTGRPIAANDFHLDYVVPTLLLPMQLVTGEFNAIGITSIGVPGIISGTNQYLLWTIVNSMVDTTDWFRLKFRNSMRRQYWWNGRWKNVETQLRSTDTAEGGQVVVKIRMTSAGPLLPVGQRGEELALSWTGFGGKSSFRPFIELPRAKHTETCGQKALTESLPNVILTCADSKNSLGEWMGGLIPIRQGSGDPRVLQNADTDRQIWGGYVAGSEKIHRTPIGDHSINTNSFPDYLNTPVDLYLGWEFAAPFRQRRLTDLIASQYSLGPADVINIQSDIVDYRHRELIHLLPLAFEKSQNMPICANSLLQSIKSWDGKYTLDSTVAPLYHYLLIAIDRRLAPAEVGVFEGQLGSVQWSLFQSLKSDLKAGKQSIMDAVRSAALEVCQFATGRPTWGQVNEALFRSFGATKPEPIAAPGAPSTVFSQGRIRGTVWRMVTQLGERPRVWFSSIGRLDSRTDLLSSSPWTQRWSKQEMLEVRFFEPSDFSSL